MLQNYYGAHEILEPKYNYDSKFDETKKAHINDRIQKNVFEVLGDDSLKFLGIFRADLNRMLARELRDHNGNLFIADFIGSADDDSIVHLEFQTTYSRLHGYRFTSSNCLIHIRENNRKVYTYVIYSADVKRVNLNFDTGTVNSNVKVIMLADFYDANFLPNLKEKILNGGKLTGQELAIATLLPLMVKGKIKVELAIELLRLADEIEDPHQRQLLAGAIIGLSKTYLNEEEYQQMEEEFKMISVLGLWEEEVRKDAHEEGREEAIVETAKNLLKLDISVSNIVKSTGLTEANVLQLKSQISY